ncbi:MAG: TonB-dependent receptor [Deltaproteobacteria bacterium]|nr:TonB-dependent receptor [Deltaproteobacteria bacterium]
MRQSPPFSVPLAVVLVALGLTHARDARAADREGEAEEEVVVRGNTAGGFVSQSTIAESKREVTDAASLVEPLPGVHVRRLGGEDSFATLSVRGTSSTQVAVYLAGVPLTGGADPTLDLATLPLWPGARARVFRSFAPAALGRGSLGGTLAIDAPTARAKPGTEVWTGIGAFGSRRLRIGDVREVGATGSAGSGVRIASGLSLSRSDDDFSYLDGRATRDAGQDVFATRANAGHAAASGLASVSMPVRLASGESGALTLTTMLQARRQELPGTATQRTPDQRLDSSRMIGALELTLPAGPGAFGVRGWGRREGLSIHDSPVTTIAGVDPTSTSDAIVAAGASIGWRGTPSERLSLEARLDGSAERFAPGTWVGAIPPPGSRRTNVGGAFDGQLRLGNTTTLAASARADAWFDTSDDGASAEEVRPTGNLGIEQVVGPFVLASHAGVLARPPSFVERYGNRGAFLGEPTLRPEDAATIDAGVRVARRLGVLRLSFEGALFATWADDLIVFVPQGIYGRAKAKNIGRARLLGTEAEVKVGVSAFDLRVSHTGLATTNLSECRFVDQRCERPPLPGRPEHDLVADLTYTSGPLRLRYGLDLVAGISADNAGSYAYLVPDRVLHSLGARLEIPGVPGLSASLDVRNLLDLRAAEYPNVLGGRDRYPIGDLFDYPIPGRRVLLSLRWVHTDAPR